MCPLTVDTQFLWMQQNGIDTAALQRFNPTGGEGPTRDAMAQKVRTAAETYARKFYIMYDVSGWTNMQSEIKTDWTTKMSAHTASTAYARQNGKPVVGIWGFGFNDANHPWDNATCLDVVNWFKGQGCYVMGGARFMTAGVLLYAIARARGAPAWVTREQFVSQVLTHLTEGIDAERLEADLWRAMS